MTPEEIAGRLGLGPRMLVRDFPLGISDWHDWMAVLKAGLLHINTGTLTERGIAVRAVLELETKA